MHGENAASARRWARNGDPSNRWTGTEADAVSWAGADVYTLYSANYLNWYHAPDSATEISQLTSSRLSAPRSPTRPTTSTSA